MNSMLCSRCKKRMAVVFVTRMEGDQTFNEGLCLQCAKELGIKPVEDLMNKMGISGEELDAISEQMMNFEENGDPDFEMGGAQAFPFLNSIFGGDMMPQGEAPTAEGEAPKNPKKTGKKGKQEEKKYLNLYCENLTEKARKGGFDPIIGRDREIGRVVQILNRRTKNNPCLIGEPGVGKTAIAEG
ncbi:MAG: ATP-dependent Clp protease ATP-binding subunit, partial [Oscillospiraceae bacterium]|nr:ATP-dependent Clp protease ATP-binding subunit [Oscillospiraceae bacterium]